ncbi:hypothetical protein N9L33_02115 [Nitrospinae bacterium]|nr:hypothetical protein [Nitrospinota bacterium]
MNTALVCLKVEMEAIIHAELDYQTEFDKILKSCKTMKGIFVFINETFKGWFVNACCRV